MQKLINSQMQHYGICSQPISWSWTNFPKYIDNSTQYPLLTIVKYGQEACQKKFIFKTVAYKKAFHFHFHSKGCSQKQIEIFVMRKELHLQFLRELPKSCSGIGKLNPRVNDVS